MNAITIICIILGATVIATATVAGILWISNVAANGYQPSRKRGEEAP